MTRDQATTPAGRRGNRVLMAVILIATMVGAAPKAEARTTEQRIARLERQVALLQQQMQNRREERRALEQRLAAEEDYSTAGFNCIGFAIGVDAPLVTIPSVFTTPVSPLLWTTSDTPELWVVTEDPACLVPTATSNVRRVRIARPVR